MAPYTGDSSDIVFCDVPKFSAGFAGTLQPGACGNNAAEQINDLYHLVVNSWTDTQIVIGAIDYDGYSGSFGTLANGDPIAVLVFNPQTNTGPAVITCTVGAGPCTVPEPSTASMLTSALLVLLCVLGVRRFSS